MTINETTSGTNSVAITGTATGDNSAGVHGTGGAVGVQGIGEGWHGVAGFSKGGFGVYGEGLTGGAGVVGKSTGWHGVHGYSESTIGGQGVNGEGESGVAGVGRTWVGVYGETRGSANGPAGVWGDGRDGGFGVKGHARAPGTAGVAGYQLNNSGPGIYGQGAPAGHFQGNVVVTGDLILSGADVAEQFDVAEQVDNPEEVDPGTVVVIDAEGALAPCGRAYDTRVAGVVSGAGDRVPALVLDRKEPEEIGGARRRAIAVIGKTWCRADASFQTIRVGDLLTTSSTRGHAMAAVDRGASLGAILGKALTPLASGTGLVLVLVGLG